MQKICRNRSAQEYHSCRRYRKLVRVHGAQENNDAGIPFALKPLTEMVCKKKFSPSPKKKFSPSPKKKSAPFPKKKSAPFPKAQFNLPMYQLCSISDIPTVQHFRYRQLPESTHGLPVHESFPVADAIIQPDTLLQFTITHN